MVEYEDFIQNGAGASAVVDVDTEVTDPYCLAEKPIKVKFQDITSAAFMIKSGIEYTPCTVKRQSLH